jgi:hypothetical protein
MTMNNKKNRFTFRHLYFNENGQKLRGAWPSAFLNPVSIR